MDFIVLNAQWFPNRLFLNMERFVIESQMFGDSKHAEWKQTVSQTNAGVVLCVVCFNSRPASLVRWHNESNKSGGISDQFPLGSKQTPSPFLGSHFHISG